jgi:NAD(P)-dependent dehydrogenase (short-subunit alcohol dehydrogenase family)
VVDTSEEDWDIIIAVNLKSMILASGAAIPKMIETGGGSIINISSIAGLRAHSQTPYTTTKSAVVGLTYSMAADHGKDNVRVNCIAPGLLYTPMTAPRMDESMRENRRSAAPLGTEGTAWDVAHAAVFLASDEARWVTGVVLPVDAGLTITSPVTYNTINQQARF